MAENTFNKAFIEKVTRKLSKKAFKGTEWRFPSVGQDRSYTTEEVKEEVRNLSKIGRFVLQIWRDPKEVKKKKQKKAKDPD